MERAFWQDVKKDKGARAKDMTEREVGEMARHIMIALLVFWAVAAVYVTWRDKR